MVKRLSSVGLFLIGSFLVFRGLVMFLSMTTSPTLALAPVESFVDTVCLDCHTDKNRLTELTDVAEVEEGETESLSSGPG